MKALTRKVGLLAAALVLTVVFILAVGSPRHANAGCGSDVTWNIWNELDSRQASDTKGGQTSNTQDLSSRSEHQSNNGQTWTDNQSSHNNADGSSHSHEESAYSDSEGKGCNSSGIPWKWTSHRDDDTDSKGNRKEHTEAIEEKNGKCIKYVRDREWDNKGNLIKDIKSMTEIPCSKYNLQVTWKGNYTLPNGAQTMTFGPNTVVVHLEDKGSTYEGKYESVFDGKVSGICNGSITWPELIEVTADKDEQFEDLAFSVKTTMREPWTLATCQGSTIKPKAGAINVPQHDFRLADESGSSRTITEGPYTWTYTLIQKK
jgi:hypothetical protein